MGRLRVSSGHLAKRSNDRGGAENGSAHRALTGEAEPNRSRTVNQAAPHPPRPVDRPLPSSCLRHDAFSPAGSVGASACGRGLHRRPAPFPNAHCVRWGRRLWWLLAAAFHLSLRTLGFVLTCSGRPVGDQADNQQQSRSVWGGL